MITVNMILSYLMTESSLSSLAVIAYDHFLMTNPSNKSLHCIHQHSSFHFLKSRTAETQLNAKNKKLACHLFTLIAAYGCCLLTSICILLTILGFYIACKVFGLNIDLSFASQETPFWIPSEHFAVQV